MAIVLAAPVCSPAQAVDDSAVVRAEAIVVNAPPQEVLQSGVTRVEMDGGAPLGSRSWDQVASSTPNLEIALPGESSFGAIIALRGLANTPYFSDSAVTLYLDAIPLGSGFTFPTDLFGFTTASVYSGPQPTAFGRSGDAGVIVLSPQSAQGATELRAGIGSYGSRTGALEAESHDGGPADVSLAAAFTRRDGYVDNTEIGQRVDSLDAVDAFARARFRPTSASQVTVEIFADRHRDGAAPLVPLGGPLFTVERPQEGSTDTDLFAAALKAVVDTGLGRLTAVTSYTAWRLNPYDDWLVLPPPLQSHLTQDQERLNEELRLASPSHGAIAWNAGAWLSGGPTSGAVERSIGGVFPIESSGYGYTKREEALFGEVLLTPSGQWRFSIGGRAQQTDEDYHQAEQVPAAGLRLKFDRTDDAFLPRIAATYSIDSQTTADASASLGTRPGGFAAYTDNPALIPFAAEHLAAFEAGLRRASLGNTLATTASVFDYEIRNYQIERSFSPTDYFVATAPRARSFGAEAGATWKPRPTWTVGLSAGYTDVTLLEFHDPLTGRSYAGNRAPYSPAYTASLSVGFRSARGWFASGCVSARGKAFFTESEDPAYAQGAYVTIDGTAGLDTARWRIAAFVENAENKGYYSLIIPGVNSAAPGAPRTMGSELTVKF